MWSDRRLLELFGIEHPIVLAPMAGFATVELAAIVSNAGGLGSIGCATMDLQRVTNAIAQARRLTSKPVSLNFFCHEPARADAAREWAWHDRLSPYYRELGIDETTPRPRTDLAPFGGAMCELVEDARPDVVSFHFGLPASPLVARIKSAGCKVISSATTVAEARWLEDHGADAVIAQGYEAGGHRGTFLGRDQNRAVASQLGTFELVPQITDAVSVPVIAAGGIADGRGIAAALSLGASGAEIGTAFLLCPEAATPPLHRDALRQARELGTVVTNVLSGRPARALVNRLIAEVGPLSDAVPDFPLPMGELAPLRAAAERKGSRDFTPIWAGQGAALARELPAKALMQTLVKEAVERLKRVKDG
ncbi:nitronate monooxygenase family protein [Bradyrhizobium sp. Leo170]|uniref:NAD(P)H-dependent flavin oxidoreductase n=1 Tax=Bradyrhizobium sp. Leo170 TaxID=1571199 RepID=UPI00102EA046|nr:nitronate monooxygenase family protein [Bradyrhizobium sp. Leo170]TAI65460.1 2-nitropropane dioxygenase [Bradyrhizobium sp. Leo170]